MGQARLAVCSAAVGRASFPVGRSSPPDGGPPHTGLPPKIGSALFGISM